MVRKAVVLGACVNVLLLVTLALGASPSPPPPAPLSGAMSQLYELAKKEGQLVFNCAGRLESWQPFADVWKKRFPDIKLEMISVHPPSVPARIITEHGAGKVSIDASLSSIESTVALISRDLLQRYDWTGLNIDKQDLIVDGRMVKDYDYPYIIYYNSKLVSKADAPRTWEDLLNPRWKGKICLLQGSVVLRALHRKWGEKQAAEYVKKLSKQEVIPGLRPHQMFDKVARGEILISEGSISSFMFYKDQGSPIEVAPISPQFSTQMFLLAYKDCPHPNAAKFFIAWSLGPEGRKAMLPVDYFPNPRIQQLIRENKIEMMGDNTVEEATATARITKEYDSLLGLVPK